MHPDFILDFDSEHLVFTQIAQGLMDVLQREPALLNKRTSEGEYTPLMIAVAYEQMPIIEWLIAQGVSLSARDSQGDSALIHAILGRNFEIIQYLVEHGKADVNQCGESHVSPLLLAVLNSDIDTVEFLIRFGAELDIRDNWHRTPLMTAADRGDLAMVQCLLAHGAKMDISDNMGYTPLLFALQNPNDKVLLFMYYCYKMANIASVNDLPQEVRNHLDDEIKKEIAPLKESEKILKDKGLEMNLIRLVHTYQSNFSVMANMKPASRRTCPLLLTSNPWLISIQLGLFSGFVSGVLTHLGFSSVNASVSGTMLAFGSMYGYRFFSSANERPENPHLQFKPFNF